MTTKPADSTRSARNLLMFIVAGALIAGVAWLALNRGGSQPSSGDVGQIDVESGAEAPTAPAPSASLPEPRSSLAASVPEPAPSPEPSRTLTSKERRHLRRVFTATYSSIPAPIQGNKNTTIESVWDWWQKRLAINNELLKQYPEMEEELLHSKQALDCMALTLLESVNTNNMNPVQRQEKYDKEDILASIYAQHMDEYLAKATDEDSIFTVQYNKSDLLERYDITKQPAQVSLTMAGESLENAYDASLRNGTCLLRTARIAAGKYADAADYDKAIAVLERAVSDASSGNYEVRDSGGLDPLGKRASILDIQSLIAKYKADKPNADKLRASWEKYDKFMEEQMAEDSAYVEEYRQKIERGEVPAEGFPEKDAPSSTPAPQGGEPNAAAPVAATANAAAVVDDETRLLEEANALGESGDFLGAASKRAQMGDLFAAASWTLREINRLSNSTDSADLERALELYQKIRRDYPESTPARRAPFDEVKLYEKLGREQDAIALLNQWLEANPDDSQQQGARVMLVRFYMKADRPQDALNTLLPLYDRYKDAGGIPPEQLCAMVAGAYGACGDVHAAIGVWEDFKQRVSAAPAAAFGSDSPELTRTRVLERVDAQIAILKGE